MYPVLDSVLDAMLSCSEVVWLLPMFDVDVSIKSFAGLCNCQRELPQTHTHTCSETAYRIIDVECIKRAKNTSVKSDRNGWMIRSEKLCEGNLSTSLLEGSLSLCSFGCSAGFPHQNAQAQQSGHRLLLLSLFVSFTRNG